MMRGRAVCALVALTLLAHASGAEADVFRQSVVVEVDSGQTRRLAEMQADSRAQKALIEAFLNERLSPAILEARGQQTRVALEPVSGLLSNFTIVSRDVIDATHYRLTCEAEFDSGALALRLVTHRVLSFASSAPRLLLLPEGGTDLDTVRTVRGVMANALGSSGITLLAAEAVPTDGFVRGRLDSASAVGRAAIDARADFVALVSWRSQNPRSPVGGVIVDTALQYTLLRAHDAAIVGEAVFEGRGSGPTHLVAARAALTEVAPAFARGLAGHLTENVFANGSVIDRDAATPDVILRVLSRPGANATNVLMGALRERGLRIALGAGRVNIQPDIPADQLVISGLDDIERLYDMLATLKFGDGAWQTSIFDYNATSMSVEIVGTEPPRFAKAAKKSSIRTGVPSRAAVAVETRSQPASTVAVPPASQPVTAVASVSASGRPAPVTLRPLEFEFSAAFVQATRTRGR